MIKIRRPIKLKKSALVPVGAEVNPFRLERHGGVDIPAKADAEALQTVIAYEIALKSAQVSEPQWVQLGNIRGDLVDGRGRIINADVGKGGMRRDGQVKGVKGITAGQVITVIGRDANRGGGGSCASIRP